MQYTFFKNIVLVSRALINNALIGLFYSNKYTSKSIVGGGGGAGEGERGRRKEERGWEDECNLS